MTEEQAKQIVERELKEFDEVVNFLRLLHMQKAREYLDSWCKRGESGVFHNVMRKADRLENIFLPFLNHAKDELDRQALADTLADQAVYCMKWLGRLATEWGKEDVKAWAVSNSLIDDKSTLEWLDSGPTTNDRPKAEGHHP